MKTLHPKIHGGILADRDNPDHVKTRVEFQGGSRTHGVALSVDVENQAIREILEQEPGPSAESEVNYRAAEVYIALGKRDRALGHLTAAVAREPDGQWAAKSQEYLKLLR